MKLTTWDKVVEFFNQNYSKGSNWHQIWRGRFISDSRFKKTSVTLIETYRLYLTRAGYILHIGRGMYLIVRPIPLSLTSKECYRKAYRK